MYISFMVFSPTTSYQIFPSTLLFLLTTRNKPVSWWRRCLARHGFRVPGCFMSCTKVINLQPFLSRGIWWCLLCFSASSSLPLVQSLFFIMSSRTCSQNVQINRCHIEGRKVKQKGFHFSELYSLQCTVMCYHMQSLKVFPSNALL